MINTTEKNDYIIKINPDPIFQPIVYSSKKVETSSSDMLKRFVIFIIGFLSFICLIWSLIRFYSYLNNNDRLD